MKYPFHFQPLLLLLTLCAAGVVGCARSSGTAVWIDQDEVANLRKSLGGEAAGKTEAVAAAEPTGFATLKGTFTLVGTAPARVPLSITKDQSICMPDGKQVLGEQLVVNSSGGIKDVLIFCNTKFPAGDPRWEHASYTAAKSEKVIFDQKNCVFLTHVVAARTGQTVLLKNSDTVAHNANIVAKGKALSSNFNIGSNSSSDYLITGESAEPFDVSCSVHPWMAAKMITRDNPCYAVTKADGSFEIKNVPAGVPLDFKIWQESCNFISAATIDGKAVKLPKGKLTLKDQDVLKPDEQRTIEVTVDLSVFAK